MAGVFIDEPFGGQAGCVHRQDNLGTHRSVTDVLRLVDLDATKKPIFSSADVDAYLVFMAGLKPPNRSIFVPHDWCGA